MMIFFILIVVALIIGIAYILIKVLKDQKEVVEQVHKEEAEFKEKNRTITDKVIEYISDGDFSDLLAESKKEPQKLDELKVAVQNELRKAMKTQNTAKARECNQKLKQIDQISKGM